MSMSISAVCSGRGGGFDPSKMASMMANDLDPNNTDKVTKDQFVSGLTAKGVTTADATEMYDSIDTQKTGGITKSNIETAIQNGKLKPPSGAPQGDPRSAGGPGESGKSGGPGGAGGAGGASISSQTYAAADTIKDGAVSPQGAAIYARSHPSPAPTESTKTKPSNLGQNVDKLAHIIYTSTANQDFQLADLVPILAAARSKNAQLSVTGMLLYVQGSFFQVLEGEETTLMELFAVIAADPRHQNVTRIIQEPIAQRVFSDWAMGLVQADTAELERIDGINDYFRQGGSLTDLKPGRAKKLLSAFAQGRWRTRLKGDTK